MAMVIQSNTILTVNLISSVIWMLLWELLKQLLEAFESMHLGTDTSEKPLRLRATEKETFSLLSNRAPKLSCTLGSPGQPLKAPCQATPSPHPQ